LPPGQAGILIGIVWAVWHLPLIVLVPSGTGEIPFWFFFPFTVALGVIFAWGYNRTGHSVLFAVLLHAGINTMSGYQILTADDNTNRLMIGLLLVVLLAAAAYRSLARGASNERA
jgi:membrane protease YdiL (CAAX protease family)